MTDEKTTAAADETIVITAEVADDKGVIAEGGVAIQGDHLLLVARFADPTMAAAVYDDLLNGEVAGKFHIDGVLVAKSDQGGNITIQKLTDHHTRRGLKWGVVAGVVAGIVFPPEHPRERRRARYRGCGGRQDRQRPPEGQGGEGGRGRPDAGHLRHPGAHHPRGPTGRQGDDAPGRRRSRPSPSTTRPPPPSRRPPPTPPSRAAVPGARRHAGPSRHAPRPRSVRPGPRRYCVRGRDCVRVDRLPATQIVRPRSPAPARAGPRPRPR